MSSTEYVANVSKRNKFWTVKSAVRVDFDVGLTGNNFISSHATDSMHKG